ncbi:MAG: class I SAM-dependent methyltransferase [Desulfobacterales bacterium]|nr:class I SAM-dependent methyltransferase [Desulfobacterales bacterium]
MLNVLLKGQTAYSSPEAWFYDFFIAKGVVDLMDHVTLPIFTSLSKENRLLDVGCGGGHILVSLAKRGFSSLSGIDLCFDQVKRAKKRLQSIQPHAEMIQGSALYLPFPSNIVDTVISVGSIKHWPNAKQGVDECIRVLKPGGYIIILEIDRGCRLDDAMSFVDRCGFPKFVKPIFLAIFRTWVAGHAFDLDDARQFFIDPLLEDKTIERLDKTPAIVMSGKKIKEIH